MKRPHAMIPAISDRTVIDRDDFSGGAVVSFFFSFSFSFSGLGENENESPRPFGCGRCGVLR